MSQAANSHLLAESGISLETALCTLQTPSSQIDSRMMALRFVQEYVKSSEVIDSFTRERINQAVLENVLEIVLGEDRTADLMKRQLMRTECFLILASLLESPVLFRDTQRVIEGIIRNSGSDSEVRPDEPTTLRASKSEKHTDITSVISDVSELVSKMKSKKGDKTSWLSKSTSDLSLMKPLIEGNQNNRSAKSSLHKRMKPRPSILYGGEAVDDYVVPGTDPSNWIEHDKKLGYQKTRMWFPVALDKGGMLIPETRPGPDKMLMSDKVVEEYMQMKSMLSYVGDLVTPFKRDSAVLQSNGSMPTLPTGGFAKRVEGVINSSRYDAAVKQAVQIWSPLIGTHLPVWAKSSKKWSDSHGGAIDKKKYIRAGTAAAAEAFAEPDDQSSTTSASATASFVSSENTSVADGHNKKTAKQKLLECSADAVERKIVFTKGVLRRLLRKELYYAKNTSRTLKDALQVVVEDNIVGRKKIIDLQSQLTSNLQSQLDTLQSSMDALKSLTRETIKLQYQMLPPRYLLVVDGKRANPRKHVARLVSMFCQFRRATLLAMAMGTWKIVLKHDESVAKRPQYAKAASLHLMVGWVQNIKYKQMSNFANRWIKEVQLMIFHERSKAVLPLQTLYRVWRDRRKFIRMHKMATYGGPLSDIYLAPFRPNVKFFIPLVIRTGKRTVWFAAVTIQSAWKSSRLWRIYQVRRKQVVLIQSLCRMWPKRVQFLRLRATAIKCQAWMRRTVKRVQYLRLRRCTIIVQKYVRRYLATLLKLRKFNEIWIEIEQKMAAVIKIQCRWRILIAQRRVQYKKDYIKKRLWAVLTLQRSWYRSKGAFHTFLLMGCYRETTLEDERFKKYVDDLGRFRAARRIQRIYRELYHRRLMSAVIKVQCWYRGRLGYNLVDILRKQKWASRKLHHWARVMMKWKHKRARIIQYWWWRQKYGRLRRHLHFKAKMIDTAEDRAWATKKYDAASLIQAFAHGVWSRRWTRRHKAAITIQKPTRFFLARKRWKRELRERSLGAVTRYVSSLLSRGVRDRTTYLVRLHSRMLIKPQAWVRGHIVRCYFRRAFQYAYHVGLSAVTIQRFWRKTGSIVKAVEEVMSIRRHEQNPFKECNTMHEVLMQLRDETNRYYSYRDPRVGMRISSLLYRLGHPELIGMFPKKNYLYVKDLSHLKMEKLIELYNSWQKRKMGNNPPPPTVGALSSKGNNAHAKRTEPIDVFQLILDVVKPRLNTRQQQFQQTIQLVASVQEIFSPQECFDLLFNAFTKKFGKNFVARATNTAIAVTEAAWTDFNNFKSLTDPLTPGHIMRSIATANAGSDVKSALENVRKVNIKSQKDKEAEEDDRKWDRERVKQCAEVLQFAVDRLRSLTESGSLLADMIEKTLLRVASYKRKYSYLLIRVRAKLEARSKVQAAEATAASSTGAKNAKKPPAKQSNSKPSTDGAPHGNDEPIKVRAGVSMKDPTAAASRGMSTKDGGFANANANSEQEHHDNWTMPAESRTVAYSVEKSVDLEFTGRGEETIELEKNICICKLFLELLDSFYLMTSGVQKFKMIWRADAVSRAVAQRKVDKFLDKTTAEYLAYMNNNHVHAVWSKFRKIETTAYRTSLIMEAVLKKKNAILVELSLVPRYGWQSYVDDNGYTYWIDSSGKEPSTYEMPTYRFDQYKQILRIQKRSRLLLRALELRRILKENARQREIAMIEDRRAKEISRSGTSRAVYVTLQIKRRLLSQFLGSVDATPPAGESHDHNDHLDHPDATASNHGADGATVSGQTQPTQQAQGHDPVSSSAVPRRNSVTGQRRGSLSAPNASAPPPPPMNTDPEMELLLPPRLRLQPAKPIFSGGWYLYQSVEELHGQSVYKYDVVMACRVRDGGKICDVKFGNGKKQTDVKGSSLFQLNLEQGSIVEARFKGELDFYKGKITSITPAFDGNNRFAILYDDGEKEFGLTADLIRIPAVTLNALLRERNQQISKLEKQLLRSRHFGKLKAERLARTRRIGLSTMEMVSSILQGKQIPPIQQSIQQISAGPDISSPLPTTPETRAVDSPGGEGNRKLPKKSKGRDSIMVAKTSTEQVPMGLTSQNMMVALDLLQSIHSESKIIVKFIRILRYGWVAVKNRGVTQYHKYSAHQLQSRGHGLHPHSAHAHAHGNRHHPSSAHSHGHSHAMQRHQHGSFGSGSPRRTPHLGAQASFDEPEEISDVPPLYSPAEEFAATKMQSVIRMRIGRLRFKKELFKDSLGSIINRAIMKAKRIAFVGFGQEGLNTYLILRRLGLWELADALEAHLGQKFKKIKDKAKLNAAVVANAPSLEKLASLSVKDMESYGIKRQDLAHEVTKFQNWWNKTNAAGHDAASMLVNYYTDESDTRSLRECIRDKEEYILSRFLASFPAHEARTKAAVKRIVGSLYPHGYQQIESYIQKYLQSPELARESVQELIDKPTTHTWVEEAEAFVVLRAAVRRVGIICGVLKLQSMRRHISAIEEEADLIFYSVSQNRKRAMCSGPEARAALKLRNLCEYLKKCFKSTVVIQKNARRFVLRMRYLRNLSSRVKGIALIQRVGRGYMGRNKAYELRMQQQSEWEQLWDSKRTLLYYFNRIEFHSTYEEPDVPFRPLVRDRRSAVLMQSWPFLDINRGNIRSEADLAALADALHGKTNPSADTLYAPAIESKESTEAPVHSSAVIESKAEMQTSADVPKNMCGNCGIRKVLRHCNDCAFEKELAHYPNLPQPVTYSSLYPQGFPLCYPCFNSIHENASKADHRYSDVAPDAHAKPFLSCSMCDQPATRKCNGLLTSREIEDIVMDLTHAGPERWFTILQNANVGSDEKIQHILQALLLENDQRKLTAAQIQQVTDLLERSKAECDDCYCGSCYILVHTKGKRALHKWRGFCEYADPCIVCNNAPAELNCADCNSKYCDSCFNVFHNMGRKKRHRRTAVVEEMNAFDKACELCHRRKAEFVCPNTACETNCCDSCYECVHKPRCDYEHKKGKFVAKHPIDTRANSPSSMKSSTMLSGKSTKSTKALLQPKIIVCVSCGEIADTRCAQCGDYYCSNTWMGHEGCFAEFHAKGNRTSHTKEPFWQELPVEEGGGSSTNNNEGRSAGNPAFSSKSREGDDPRDDQADNGDDEDDDGDLSPEEDIFDQSGKKHHRHHHHHHRHHHKHHSKHHSKRHHNSHHNSSSHISSSQDDGPSQRMSDVL